MVPDEIDHAFTRHGSIYRVNDTTLEHAEVSLQTDPIHNNKREINPVVKLRINRNMQK